MPQTPSHRTDSSTVWYFAYGSNLSSRTFGGTRGITPLDAVTLRIPDWCLVFDIPGLPYLEPGWASIQPRQALLDSKTESSPHPDVEGVAYLITREQYAIMIASEASDATYHQSQLKALPIFTEDVDRLGLEITVLTLTTSFPRAPAPLPSARYMGVIESGAEEQGLSSSYLQHLSELPAYQPPDRRQFWPWLGAMLFLGFWRPVYRFVLWSIRATADAQGRPPPALITLMQGLLLVMWFWHDHVQSRIFGRGDGLDQPARESFEQDKRARALS